MRLAIVNLLWLFFTLLGLVIAGFFPATIALFTIINTWLNGENTESLIHTFWKHFRKYFFWGNKLGIILLLFLTIVYIDYQLIESFQGLFYWFIAVLLTFITALLFISFMFIFPVIVNYRIVSLKNTLMNSLLIGISQLPFVIVGYAILFLLIFVFRSIVSLAIFFFPSALVLIICFITNRAISRVEMKRQQYNQN